MYINSVMMKSNIILCPGLWYLKRVEYDVGRHGREQFVAQIGMISVTKSQEKWETDPKEKL